MIIVIPLRPQIRQRVKILDIILVKDDFYPKASGVGYAIAPTLETLSVMIIYGKVGAPIVTVLPMCCIGTFTLFVCVG